MTRVERETEYRELFSLAGKEGFNEAAKPLVLGDLYFLLAFILNRKEVRRDWLYDRCMEVQASPDGYLDLWAREHFKSTIITYAKTIQDILANPEITVGIFSHTRPIAKAFLRQIKREFEGNDTLKQLFPDVLYANPAKESPKWSEDDGIIVKRKGNPKEATVEAWGLVDGQPTGRHFALMVYDDVVTRESVTSPEMIKKVTDAWELSLNLGADGGAVRYIGTRYHTNDTYKVMMQRGAVKPRIHPATTDGTENGEPVLLSREKLAEKRRDMGPYTFGCQMLQNPTADKAQGFKREWVRLWKPVPEHWAAMNRAILVDPAGSKKTTSDYTVMAVVGWNSDRRRYLIHAIRDRLNLTERTRALFKLVREYQPQVVGYEQYGMQADAEHIEAEMARQNYYFSITRLGGSMPKPDRIRRLVPLFERGEFFLPIESTFSDWEGNYRNFTTMFLEEEYESFPVSSHDDMLDCLSRCCDAELGMEFPQAIVSPQASEGPQFAHGYQPMNIDNYNSGASYEPRSPY